MTFSKDIHAFLDEEKARREQENEQAKVAEVTAHSPSATKEPVDSGIKGTKDYDMFTVLKTNRSVDMKHVRRLAREIKKKNLLHLNPIVVDSEFRIIDGQHRREAARQLGVTIYYIQDDSVSENDIAGLNSNKKNWALMDYVNFYAAKGEPAYVKFAEFCRKNRSFPPATLAGMCNPDGKRDTESIQNGRMDVSNMLFAEMVISYLNDFSQHTELARSSRFIEAIIFIASHPDYDHARMIGKVATNPMGIVPCANKKQYIQILQGIYNKGVREQNIVIFLKR